MNPASKKIKILAVSLSTRGFGYAILKDGTSLVDYGNKRIRKDKNARSLAHIEKMFVNNKPDILVLQDVNAKGTHRAPRIKRLHLKLIDLAEEREIKMVKISATELRSALLGNKTGTKQEMADMLAKRFPDELAMRLPPKRRTWESQDARMDTFDAAGLAVGFEDSATNSNH